MFFGLSLFQSPFGPRIPGLRNADHDDSNGDAKASLLSFAPNSPKNFLPRADTRLHQRVRSVRTYEQSVWYPVLAPSALV